MHVYCHSLIAGKYLQGDCQIKVLASPCAL